MKTGVIQGLTRINKMYPKKRNRKPKPYKLAMQVTKEHQHVTEGFMIPNYIETFSEIHIYLSLETARSGHTDGEVYRYYQISVVCPSSTLL